MKKQESDATIMRNKGNEIFRKCTDHLPYTIMNERLKQAIEIYESAIKLSISDDELSKANKNIALCCQRLFNKIINNNVNKQNIEECLFHGSNCLKFYLFHLRYSKTYIKLEEESDIVTKITSHLSNILNIINHKAITYEQSLQKLFKLSELITWNYPIIRAYTSVSIAKKYLSKGIDFLENMEYIKAMSNFENTRQMVNEALYYKDYISEDNIFYELNDFHESAIFYIIRSKALMYIKQGMDLFNAAVYLNEDLKMDQIFDAIDKYREALLQTGCFQEGKVDIELEAICYSKLGYIFYHIFKNSVKSEILVKQSVDLGLSMHPKNVGIEEWYKSSVAILKEIRNKREKEEREKKDEVREKYMKELSEDLDKINNIWKEKSVEQFMKYILTNYPPQENLNFNVDEQKEKTNTKKVILKVITFYHPDKFSNEDMKKKILMEEITKLLTTKYEYFKE